jgi:hypothetical protein
MRRREWLVVALAGLGGIGLAPAVGAAEATMGEAGEIRPLPQARRPRRPARQAPASVPPAAVPPAEVGEVRPFPAIDGPAVQPIGPGQQPAPVPAGNAQPPLVDRQPRPSIALGVPTPSLFGQGETFTRQDSVNEQARAQQGGRLPSPGATLRLPIW